MSAYDAESLTSSELDEKMTVGVTWRVSQQLRMQGYKEEQNWSVGVVSC